MKVLKRISLKNVSEYLSNREMKNVVGGYDDGYDGSYDAMATKNCTGPNSDCNKMKLGEDCIRENQCGCCAAAPFAGYICKVPC